MFKVTHFHFLNNSIDEGKHPPALAGVECDTIITYWFRYKPKTRYYLTGDGTEWYLVSNSKKIKDEQLYTKLRSEYMKYLLLSLADKLSLSQI